MIFLCSIVYITVGYEAVNDFKQISDANVNKHAWREEELEILLRQWRQEYDHPSVVTKSRRVQVLKTQTKDINTWDTYIRDPLFK